jgi:hypothetical protein
MDSGRAAANARRAGDGHGRSRQADSSSVFALPPVAGPVEKKTIELETPQPALEGGESEPIRVVPPTSGS